MVLCVKSTVPAAATLSNGLVIWTAGNVSARVPGHDLMVIKPSGVSYDELTPEAMVVTDLHGVLVDGDHAPSSDTAAHGYVYRHLSAVGGVVHTHSTYATAQHKLVYIDRGLSDEQKMMRETCRAFVDDFVTPFIRQNWQREWIMTPEDRLPKSILERKDPVRARRDQVSCDQC